MNRCLRAEGVDQFVAVELLCKNSEENWHKLVGECSDISTY